MSDGNGDDSPYHKSTKRDPDRPSRKVLSRFWSAGRWVMFPIDFTYVLNTDEAVLLAFLANHADVVMAEDRKDGWFYCTQKTIQTKLRFKSSKQERLFRSLKDKGFIDTTFVGLPAKRMIKIRQQQLWDAIANAQEAEAPEIEET